MLARRTIYVAAHLAPEPPSLDERIADYLAALLGPARPRRFSKMTRSGDAKYFDLSGPLTRQMLLSHASGAQTYAATLDQDGKARAGAIDVDQGGRAVVMAVLSAAHKKGLSAIAFLQDDGSSHRGGHIWFLYDGWYPVADVYALLDQVRQDAGLPDNTEIWPRDKANNRGSDQGIRLPFGYHQRNRTRGELLSQAGELVSLDNDLAAGLDLMLAIVSNSAPPAVDQSSDKGDYTKSGHVQTRRQPFTVAKTSPGERAAERASLADVRDRFNAEHDWAELLSSYGGVETRDGWACACGWQHSHDTQIAITSQDKIVSFSPNCSWAPHKDSGRALDKFGFYVLVEHGNNVIAALKELNPIKRQRRPEAPQPAPVYRTAAQVADADRKRTERRQAAERRRNTIISRAAIDDDLPWQARALLDIHLRLAGQCGWHRASVARMAEMLGRGDRWVQRFNEYLIDRYVSRALTSRHDTAIWTLLENPIERATAPEADDLGVIELGAENNGRSPESISNEISYPDLGACEPRACPPAESVYPPTLPAWQLAKVAELEAKSDAELVAWMSQYATPAARAGETEHNGTPEKDAGDVVLNTEPPEQDAPVADFSPIKTDSAGFAPLSKTDLPPGWALRRSGPFTYATDGQRSTKPSSDASAVYTQAWALFSGSSRAGGFVQNSYTKKETDLLNSCGVIQSPEPLTDLTPEKADTAGNSHYTNTDPLLDLGDGWRGFVGGAAFNPDARGLVEPPAPEQPPVVIQLDPLVQAPPLATDATYGDFIWRWYASRPGAICKRTGKPWTAGQRQRFRREAEALLVDVTPAEAALRWDAMRQPAPSKGARSQARGPKARRALGPQATLNL